MDSDALQWVLTPLSLKNTASSDWKDVVVLLPIVGGALSILHLSFYALRVALIKKRSKLADAEVDTEDTSLPLSYVEQLGGRGVLAFRVIRAVVALALFGVVGVVQVVCGEGAKTLLDVHSMNWANVGIIEAWGMFGIYLYAFLLTLLILLPSPLLPFSLHSNIQKIKTRKVLSVHATLLILLSLLCLCTLDVWPYANLYPVPYHNPKSWVTWVRVSLLTVLGVIVPGIEPRVVTVSGVPAPEDSASLLSRITFSFVDYIVFRAYYARDVVLSDMPEIPSVQRAKYLTTRAFKFIDPLQIGKKRHFFFGILRLFASDYTQAAIWTSLNAVSRFIGPWCLSNLLEYLDRGTLKYGLRPWFWVALLSLSPLLTASMLNQYLYVSSRISVDMDSALTQLVMEHALRMRLKGDALDEKTDKTSQDGSKSGKSSPSPNSGTSTPRIPDTESELGDAETDVATVTETSTLVEEPTVEGGHVKKQSANLIGKINNLITSDLGMMNHAHDVLNVPAAVLQIFAGVAFLYYIIGWSAFVGLAIILISIPIPAYVGKKILQAQTGKTEVTDQRVQAVTENLGVLRMIKLFAWESKVLDQLNEKRDKELSWIKRNKLLDVILLNAEVLLPALSMLGTFGTYTMIMKQEFTAAKAFPALNIFSIIQEQLWTVILQTPEALRSKVSFDRYNQFINDTEILGNTTLGTQPDPDSTALVAAAPTITSDEIGFKDALFTWVNPGESASGDGNRAAYKRAFKLRLEGEVLFKRNKINLIVGSTASGKTSLLMALLGEMYYEPQSHDSWYNLPRHLGVAYAAQESWVLNATVRENIVFREEYDPVRYKAVLHQCALERDLSLWEAGDHTEVGEKGLTLSGGQKTRLTLARALYSSAQILLLDDILAALDVHTARWIIEKGFKGDLVKNRTIILVTHNIPLAAPIADHVIAFGRGGRISAQGSISDVLNHDARLKAVAQKERAQLEKANEILDEDPLVPDTEAKATDEDDANKKSVGKLIVAEEKAIGRVETEAVMILIGGIGGWVMWTVILTVKTIRAFLGIAQPWFIGYWTTQYALKPKEEIYPPKYLALFMLIIVLELVFESASETLWIFRYLRAVRLIHVRLLKSIFSAPLRWLDVTPVGRMITRCTKDIDCVDDRLGSLLSGLIYLSIALSTLFVTTVFQTGWPALVSGTVITVAGGWLGNVYLKAQLPIRREMSNARAPMMSSVGTALAGLISIRAYGCQEYFRIQLRERVDNYVRSALTFYNINRWIGFRADVLGGLFAGAVSSYLVYGLNASASSVGFTMSLVLSFARQILWWVRLYNLVEIECNSLERILEFYRAEQEPEPTEDGQPPAYWPSSGHLVVEHLNAKYSDDGPPVLNDLTFEIKPGEKIGIVGRTGAGKSTIALALLRAIKTTGTVIYDSIPTDKINLNALRSAITLIPQQPELLRGTLRENLDPFNMYDDAVLNDALKSAGLWDLQKRVTESGEEHPQAESSAKPQTSGADESSDAQAGVLTLDSHVDSGGTNFSLGQRQIVALARAMIRGSKLLLLDEATAAIDYETDTAIQRSLRTQLSSGTTIITIAHRLQTIMDYDKIMVLDAGRLVEFDTPKKLLRKDKATYAQAASASASASGTQSSGYLRSLVEESEDKANLYALAGLGPDGHDIDQQ